MKLIDLIELLFRPLPVQFEPVPWVGPMPDRWLHDSWSDRVWASDPDTGGHMSKMSITRFRYSDRFVETVSAARVVPGRRIKATLVELRVNGELWEHGK